MNTTAWATLKKAWVAAAAGALIATLTVAPPARAGESGVLFGTAVPIRNNLTAEEAVAQKDWAYGRPTPMPISRVFYRQGPEPWPGWAGESGRPVVVSFSYPPLEVLAGDHDDELTTWFEGAPDYDVYWSYWHEPEDNAARGQFTGAEYRAAWRYIAALADDAAPATAQLHATLILMCWTLNPRSGRNWLDFYEPTVHTMFSFDCYNHAWRRGAYGAPGSFLRPLLNWAEDNPDKPWGLSEFGSIKVESDTNGSRRAAWLRDVGAFLAAQHTSNPETAAQFGIYFDVKGPKGTDFRLSDWRSRNAWRDVVQNY